MLIIAKIAFIFASLSAVHIRDFHIFTLIYWSWLGRTVTDRHHCAQAHTMNGSNLNCHIEKNKYLYCNKQLYSLSKYLSDMSIERNKLLTIIERVCRLFHTLGFFSISDYVDSLCELRLPVLSVDSILLGITTYTSLLNSKAILEIRHITHLDVEWETINIS